MNDLDRWMAQAAEALGLTGFVDLDAMRDLVLDVAREVAHTVDRPAAPVTAFLLGLAAGRSEDIAHDPSTVTVRLADTIRDLAARWPG
jgi:hypothetical protein